VQKEQAKRAPPVVPTRAVPTRTRPGAASHRATSVPPAALRPTKAVGGKRASISSSGDWLKLARKAAELQSQVDHTDALPSSPPAASSTGKKAPLPSSAAPPLGKAAAPACVLLCPPVC